MDAVTDKLDVALALLATAGLDGNVFQGSTGSQHSQGDGSWIGIGVGQQKGKTARHIRLDRPEP